MESKEKRLAYGIAELAAGLGVSTGFLRLEISRNRLHATRLGRRVVILASEVERYLATGERAEAAH